MQQIRREDNNSPGGGVEDGKGGVGDAGDPDLSKGEMGSVGNEKEETPRMTPVW